MIFLQLAFEFLKIGLFAVGGGMATIPFLYDLVDKYTWFTAADLTDMIAISESTPGPVGINMATYVGYTAASAEFGLWGGIAGAFVATFAVVVPSLVIIMIIAKFMLNYSDNKLVRATFSGLRPAVAALITLAAVSVIKITLFNIPGFEATGQFFDLIRPIPLAVFGVMLFMMLKFKKIDPLWYLLVGAVLGLFLPL